MTELQEARLLGRAINNRWDVPNAVKADVIETLHHICINGAEESAQIAAGRAIIAAEAQNQKDEHAKIDEFRERILTIAQRCGIDVALLGLGDSTQRGTGVDDAEPAFHVED